MSSHTFAGQWITSPELAELPIYHVFHRQLDRDQPANPHADVQNRHVLFRRKFLLDAVEPNTLIHITADDYYKLYINGQFVTQGPAPAYPFRYFYNSIDVTRYLLPGENTIAVHTYYQGLINRVWVSGDNRHGLLLDLVVNDRVLLASDTSFKCHEHTAYSSCGLAGYKTQFLEHYDARAPETRFFVPTFNDRDWACAALRKNPDWHTVPQPSRQLEFELISPVDVQREGQLLRLDFGAIYVGYLAIMVRGPAGSTVTMRFGQELQDDGSVRHAMRCNCNYVEYMTLSGNADALNQFDYKSFRYVELELPPEADIAVQHVRLIARHYPFKLAAKPKYTDPEALKVWNLCVDTLRYGVQEVIQDCMDREKGYYMGDGCYSLLTYCLLQNDFSLMEKFIDDCLDTAFVNPGLMTCADCAFMQEIAEYPLIMITTILPYLTMTGNLEFIRPRYGKLRQILDFYAEQYAEADGLLNNLDKWCVVEWPSNLRDGYDADVKEGKVCTDKHNAINAYYLGAIKCLNRIAQLLGLAPYRDDVPQLQQAFVEAFYDPQRHLFRDSIRSSHVSLPANAFAAFYGLLPDAACKAAVLDLIREKRLHHALLFVPFPMLSFLVREGEDELVHSLLTDPDAWLHILEEGGTRTFEGWAKDLKWNTSLFHLTLSFAAAFMIDWPLKQAFDF